MAFGVECTLAKEGASGYIAASTGVETLCDTDIFMTLLRDLPPTDLLRGDCK